MTKGMCKGYLSLGPKRRCKLEHFVRRYPWENPALAAGIFSLYTPLAWYKAFLLLVHQTVDHIICRNAAVILSTLRSYPP